MRLLFVQRCEFDPSVPRLGIQFHATRGALDESERHHGSLALEVRFGQRRSTTNIRELVNKIIERIDRLDDSFLDLSLSE